MATNIDTGLTVATGLISNQTAHIWRMSDGNKVAVYFNGTNFGYRIYSGGSWGAFTSLSTLPATGVDLGGAGCRKGDTLFFGSGSNTVSLRVAKMVYSGGSLTVTYTSDTADTAPVFALYYDSTQDDIHVLFRLSDVGCYIRNFNVSDLASTIASAVTGAPADSGANQKYNWYALAGNGTSTFYAVMGSAVGSTAIAITQLVWGGATYTQTAETGVTAMAANVAGLDACYDGTNIIIVANENNAKLRRMTRTAANTYSAWTDLDANTIALAPSITVGGSGDLNVVYRRNSGQANGEIYCINRISNTWQSAILLAGGAATGWQTPSAAETDSNETAGTARIVYITGTASTWTLVEDTFMFSTPPQYIRPDADNATGGWATAPLYSKINEASPDGTVITCTAA